MRLFKKKVYYYSNFYSTDAHGKTIVTRKYEYPHWTTLFDEPALKMVPCPHSDNDDDW